MANRYKNKTNITLAYLDDVADVFDVHPRTILRALTGNPTEYWAPSHNPRLPIKEVSTRFQIPLISLCTLLRGDEEVYTPTEAASLLDMSVRAFRNKRKYKPLIVGAGFLRFAKADVELWHAELEAKKLDAINKLF